MRRANSPEPPRMATWLLEQFSPVLENAPLAGDLIEAFKQGRSASWYWRQVFWALLLALPNLLRKKWGCLAYAVSWSGLISAAWISMLPIHGRRSAFPLVLALFAKGWGFEWPWSMVYQIAFVTVFEAMIVAFALGAYLAFFRIWKPRKLLQALILVIAVLAISNVAILGIPAWWVVLSVPSMVALLLGMWTANRRNTSRHPA
jgi:hypothetical protein